MSKKRRNLPAPDQPQAPQPLLTKEDLKQAIIESYEEIDKRRSAQEESQKPTAFFKDFVKSTFYIFGFLTGSVGVAVLISMFTFSYPSSVLQHIYVILFFISLLSICGVLTIFFVAMARSVENESDKNYLVSLFSSILTFVAIILTFVSFIL